jgi:hypothetical protein
MELTECSETSVHKIQMPGIRPEERIKVKKTANVLNREENAIYHH